MKILIAFLLMGLTACASTDVDTAANFEESYSVSDVRYPAINYHANRIAYQIAEQINVTEVGAVRVDQFSVITPEASGLNRGLMSALKRALRYEGFQVQDNAMRLLRLGDDAITQSTIPSMLVISGNIALTSDEVIVNTRLLSEQSDDVYASHSQTIPFKPQQRQGLVFQAHRSYVRGPRGSDEEI
jgi:hypothetical protein